MNNYHSGHLAELIAQTYLFCKGYFCLAKNYQSGRGTTAGEVDLILKKGKTIVFIEVKKRRSLDEAAYAILPHQQQRIRRGAEAFLKKYYKYQDCDIRFDAVLIKLPFSIRHIKNAF